MEIYRIKTNNGTVHVKKDWTTEIDKQGRLKYFLYGQGYKKTRRYELINVDLEPKKDALYIGEVAWNYGDGIASDLCEDAFGCCTISARNWTPYFKHVYKVASDNFTKEIVDSLPMEIVNNLRHFIGLLDVTFLDDALSRIDSEYDNVNCTYKGKEISMKEYIKEKYGEAAMRLVSLLLN